MIVIITAQKGTIDSIVNERFGRAPYLIKVDTDSMNWEAFENANIHHAHGAGIATAQFVIDQKAELVMSGDFGPNAANTLNTAGIIAQIFPQKNMTVKEAAEYLKDNKR